MHRLLQGALAAALLAWVSAAHGQPPGDAGPPNREDAADEGGEDGTGAADDEGEPSTEATTVEVLVRGRAPLQLDPTDDATRVSGAELRDSARPTTLEALSQKAADVYVTGRGGLHGVGPGATGAITVRGLGGSPNTQVLVVEDGIADAQGIFGHPIPDAYVPGLIDEVLLIKGGDSVLYGSGALGGAILIRNRWREELGYEVTSDTAYGSFDTMRETASLLGRFEGWDVAAAFHGLTTDGHRDGADGSTVVGHTATRHRLHPDLWLTLRNKIVHLEGGDPGPVTHPHPDHRYEVWRDQASIRLDWQQDWVRLTLTPNLNVGIHELYDGFRSEDHVAGTKAELRFRFLREVELLTGLGAEQRGGDVENRITGERTPVQAATDLWWFNQLTVRPIEALALVLGTRNIASSVYGPVLVYKAGARWRIVEGLYARGRVARNFRQPTLRELYLPFPTANPELRPEISLNLDAGLGYRSEHLDLSATVYRSEVDDLIKYFGAWPAAEVVNVDHSVLWGIEGHAGLERLGPVSLFVTADWREVGRFTRQNPVAKLDATLDVSESFGPHSVGGTLSAEWVHGLYMANYEREPLDDPWFVDVAIRYGHRWPSQGVSLEPYLLLRNLLDQSYAFVAGYPMPGLNVLAGLRLELDHG